jgi:hypothetical protein
MTTAVQHHSPKTEKATKAAKTVAGGTYGLLREYCGLTADSLKLSVIVVALIDTIARTDTVQAVIDHFMAVTGVK